MASLANLCSEGGHRPETICFWLFFVDFLVCVLSVFLFDGCVTTIPKNADLKKINYAVPPDP